MRFALYGHNRKIALYWTINGQAHAIRIGKVPYPIRLFMSFVWWKKQLKRGREIPWSEVIV